MSNRIKVKRKEEPLSEFTRRFTNYYEFSQANAQYAVLVAKDALDDALQHAFEAGNREVGGIFLGYLYHRPETDARYIGIWHYIRAEMANEARMNLTFTHETWMQIEREQDHFDPGRTMLRVGWSHTHPDFGIFLSRPLDVYIHEQYFGREYQIAHVIDPIRNEAGFFLRDASRGLNADTPTIFYHPRAVDSYLQYSVEALPPETIPEPASSSNNPVDPEATVIHQPLSQLGIPLPPPETMEIVNPPATGFTTSRTIPVPVDDRVISVPAQTTVTIDITRVTAPTPEPTTVQDALQQSPAISVKPRMTSQPPQNLSELWREWRVAATVMAVSLTVAIIALGWLSQQAQALHYETLGPALKLLREASLIVNSDQWMTQTEQALQLIRFAQLYDYRAAGSGLNGQAVMAYVLFEVIGVTSGWMLIRFFLTQARPNRLLLGICAFLFALCIVFIPTVWFGVIALDTDNPFSYLVALILLVVSTFGCISAQLLVRPSQKSR